jgi:hypothetical protein
MVGLSSTNVDANYTTIQYAWYLRGDGICEIYESGAYRGNFGTYPANSIFKIAVESGVVKYYLNGNLAYSSAITPTLPLLVDASIYNVSGTVSNAIVSNLSAGDFTAYVVNAGTNPTYQWLLNGVNVGTNTNTYSNSLLGNSDVVSCLLTPDIGGCSSSQYTSNTITNIEIGAPASIEFMIKGNAATTGCNNAKEDIKWLTSSLLNVTATDNNLVKFQASNNWNGGAASSNTVSNNGSFEFTATETNRLRMAGLSSTNVDANYTTIQYAWYLRNDGICDVLESGVGRGSFGTYTSGMVFKISVENLVVKYYINNVLRYTSTVVPSMPMIADVSIYSVGGTVSDAKITNYNDGVFTATSTNSGTNPTYQWYLNGATVGTNSSTYTNTSLQNGDVITCNLIPDLPGCFTSAIESNPILNQQVSSPVGTEIFIKGNAVASGCVISSEMVVWRNADLNNVTVSNGNLTKFQANGS